MEINRLSDEKTLTVEGSRPMGMSEERCGNVWVGTLTVSIAPVTPANMRTKPSEIAKRTSSVASIEEETKVDDKEGGKEKEEDDGEDKEVMVYDVNMVIDSDASSPKGTSPRVSRQTSLGL